MRNYWNSELIEVRDIIDGGMIINNANEMVLIMYYYGELGILLFTHILDETVN